VSARIAHGRLQKKKKKIQADFLSLLFVVRQLSLPVVLRMVRPLIRSGRPTTARRPSIPYGPAVQRTLYGKTPHCGSGAKRALAFVPNLLPQPSYELLIAIGFKALSYETAFPLLLTAARWRGEGHAINVRRRRLGRRASVPNIHWGSKYWPLAKGLAIAEGQKRYSPIVFREINSRTTEPANAALCTGRALKL